MSTSTSRPPCIGYVAGSEASPARLLLIHDFYGVSDYTRQWADHFAARGLQTLVVDLYDGRSTADRETAAQWMQALDQDDVDDALHQAVAFAGGAGVGVLGWSLGGRQALRAALLEPDAVCACVVYYGRTVADPEMLRSLGGPVQVIYATQERGWPGNRDEFVQAMNQAGRMVEVHAFDAGHGFVNPHSARYDAEAAEQARRLSERFLRHHLPLRAS